MPYIAPEIILEAKKMDLLTYLRNYEPGELVHFGGNTYCTKTHDSLKISNGKWCWFSQSIGGKSALDYLIKVRGFTFLEAVEKITGQAAERPPVFISQKERKSSVLLLPQKYRYADIAVGYLLSRGIDSKLIDFCIKTGRLYESYPNHSVVFVGFDKQHIVKYAAIRGTGGSSYVGNADGSDRYYSFCINAEKPNDTVHLFESAIDLMSYATVQIVNGRDWNEDNLLSLSGIYQPKKIITESKVPSVLTQYLMDYSHIKNIVFHLDNDRAGRLATQAITTVLPKQYRTANMPPPSGKDFNDYLCDLKGIKRTPPRPKKERNDAR